MSTTQQHLLIKDVRDDIILLKNGGGALILQVSAVNFGLLSDREQMGIITAFAQMLNSLSFSIQIMIYSERLNISSYLKLLDNAQIAQKNPLLSKIIGSYRQFIQNTIKENEVLDKKFYLVIPLFALELGLTASRENLEQKIKTVLLPRRDQMVRQLSRVGLKTTQLTNRKLIELFYDIYNGQLVETAAFSKNPYLEVRLNNPHPQPAPAPIRPPQNEAPANLPPLKAQLSKTHPFVVEELEDTI